MESRAGFLGGVVWSRGRVALPRQRVNELGLGRQVQCSRLRLFFCVSRPASGVCEALEIRVVDSVGLLRWTARRRRPVRADQETDCQARFRVQLVLRDSQQ